MLGRSEPQFEYTLHFVRIDQSLVEYALYEPRAGDEFDRAAREALEGILPDGRYTTYGYEPLGSDLYVEYEGRYFETEVTVTGRRERDRTVVYAEEVPEEETPSDALLVDDLDRADARVVRIHHPNVQTGGDGGGADLLTDDGGYVLRRPAELEGRFASGDLDGRVVSMTDGEPWNYRLIVKTETVLETAYTAYATGTADSREQFREIVLAGRVDVELSPADLPSDLRALFERVRAFDEFRETTPLSESYEALLERLERSDVGEPGADNDKLLWDGDTLYSYGLYVNPAD